MNVNNLPDLYVEGLMSSFGQVTSTGLSSILGGEISHDKFTRLLSSGYFNERQLWLNAKSLYQEIRNKDAVFILDDSVE
jgi:hypothetical protein